MKFSLIGTRTTAVHLLQELVSSSGHSVVGAAISGPLANAVTSLQLPLRIVATSEDAVHDTAVDVVVIAIADPEETLRLARAASQAGKHVVVFPSAECSPAFSFELHLILDESSHAVVPVTGRFALTDLDSDQRTLNVARSETVQLSLELGVDVQLADALAIRVQEGLDLLTASGLQYAQVTALESFAPDGKLLSMLITLNSQATAEVQEPPATLVLKPAVMLRTQPVLRIQTTASEVREFKVDESPRVLSRVEQLCRNREECSRWMDSFSETLELAEAVKKSLRRRRTVDVHFDTGSERGVFKSQMTAIGCGVLTFMMFGMVAYLIMAQLMDLPNWVLHTARVLWIAPLVIFLLAQALLPFSRDRSVEK